MRLGDTEDNEGDADERKACHRDEHLVEARLLQYKSANPLSYRRCKACGHPEACLFGAASMFLRAVIDKRDPHGPDDAIV